MVRHTTNILFKGSAATIDIQNFAIISSEALFYLTANLLIKQQTKKDIQNS